MNESVDPKEPQHIPEQERDEKFIRLMKGLFFAFLLIQLLVMIFRPLFDPSECRYGNMAANMASSGNFIEPNYVYDGVFQCFEGKPPLYFQFGGLSCLLFGKNAFAVRLPALLFALLTVWFVFFAVKKATNRKIAWAAALLCFLNPMFYVYSGLCTTDMMLTSCIAGGVLAYWSFSEGQRTSQAKYYSLLFFIFLALGMLAKGPVAIVSIGLPVFIFVAIHRKWSDLLHHAWVTGTLVFAAIVVPWFYQMHKIHPDFLEYFFYHENFGRFFLKEYGDRFGNGHDSFRGVAFFVSIISNLPVLLPLLMLGFSRRLSMGGITSRPLEGISLIAAVALTLFWCPTSRVPMYYLLPTIPFFAVFIALKLFAAERNSHDRLLRLTVYVTAGMALVTALVLAIMTLFSAQVTSKMPEKFYKRLIVHEKETGQRVKAGYYFFRKTPLSAEFYLGDRVRNHPDEKTEASLTNSIQYLLMISDKNLEDLDQPLKRELLLEYGQWNLFAPAKMEER
jgi:4-amino-4-deoxy-L-arabinose transferase-like glycosyltransferase